MALQAHKREWSTKTFSGFYEKTPERRVNLTFIKDHLSFLYDAEQCLLIDAGITLLHAGFNDVFQCGKLCRCNCTQDQKIEIKLKVHSYQKPRADLANKLSETHLFFFWLQQIKSSTGGDQMYVRMQQWAS